MEGIMKLIKAKPFRSVVIGLFLLGLLVGSIFSKSFASVVLFWVCFIGAFVPVVYLMFLCIINWDIESFGEFVYKPKDWIG